MGAGRKIVGVIAVFIMIFGIIGIINAWNTGSANIKEAEQDVKESCINLKVALDELKVSIDDMTAAGINTAPMLADYNMRVAEYNESC